MLYGLTNLSVFTSPSVQVGEGDVKQTYMRARIHTHTHVLLNIINVWTHQGVPLAVRVGWDRVTSSCPCKGERTEHMGIWQVLISHFPSSKLCYIFSKDVQYVENIQFLSLPLFRYLQQTSYGLICYFSFGLAWYQS